MALLDSANLSKIPPKAATALKATTKAIVHSINSTAILRPYHTHGICLGRLAALVTYAIVDFPRDGHSMALSLADSIGHSFLAAYAALKI